MAINKNAIRNFHVITSFTFKLGAVSIKSTIRSTPLTIETIAAILLMVSLFMR